MFELVSMVELLYPVKVFRKVSKSRHFELQIVQYPENLVNLLFSGFFQ